MRMVLEWNIQLSDVHIFSQITYVLYDLIHLLNVIFISAEKSLCVQACVDFFLLHTL